MLYLERCAAGRRLRPRLQWLHSGDIVVPGARSGDVRVETEVPPALDAMILVRRLGVPEEGPELACRCLGRVSRFSGTHAGVNDCTGQ